MRKRAKRITSRQAATENKPRARAKRKKKVEALWKGPHVDGITQSQIGAFLSCPDRFYSMYIEGLAEQLGWNYRTGYGDMWHLCEEMKIQGKDWKKALLKYSSELLSQYHGDRNSQQDISKYYNFCKIQFEVYEQDWEKHRYNRDRKPVYQEREFKVEYKLPDFETPVILRGKWDSVDLLKKGNRYTIWLQDHKTKGDIKDHIIETALQYDMQVMFYLIALKHHMESDDCAKELKGKKIGGVSYNVIKRPLSPGKGSIRPHKATKNKKAETQAEYLERLRQVFLDDPEYFFRKWNSLITKVEVQAFEDKTMSPLLSRICTWYKIAVEGGREKLQNDPVGRLVHYSHPYGLYNPVNEAISDAIQKYVLTGNKGVLVANRELYPELKED